MDVRAKESAATAGSLLQLSSTHRLMDQQLAMEVIPQVSEVLIADHLEVVLASVAQAHYPDCFGLYLLEH